MAEVVDSGLETTADFNRMILWGAYRDTGCLDNEYPSCLRCPLEECKYVGRNRSRVQGIKPRLKIVEMIKAGQSRQDIITTLCISANVVRQQIYNARKRGEL